MSRTGNGHFAKSVCAREPRLAPERKLWRAVLGQAYEDAERPDGVATERELALRTAARILLRGDTRFAAELLQLVCVFADLPADRIIRWARKRYPRRPAEQLARPSHPGLRVCTYKPCAESGRGSDPEPQIRLEDLPVDPRTIH